MKKVLVCICLGFLIACQSTPGTANPDSRAVTMRPALDPSIPSDAPVPEPVTNTQKGRNAITGTIYQKSQISTILINTKVGLFQKSGNNWNKIDEANSDYRGNFSLMTKVVPGNYELRVMDPKYSGKMPLTLEKKPLAGLIFEVNEK